MNALLETTSQAATDHLRRKDAIRGFWLAMLLHLLQLPIMWLFFPWLIFIGLTQWLYLIPAILIAKERGRSSLVRGLIIGGSITFLLNATCFGAFWIAVQSGHFRIAG